MEDKIILGTEKTVLEGSSVYILKPPRTKTEVVGERGHNPAAK